MANLMRFGRRLALPSTRQIRHELIGFILADEARIKDADERKKLDADPIPPVTTVS